MFENPFTKIKKMQNKIKELKAERDWWKVRVNDYMAELKQANKIIHHWQALAKVTFIMFCISITFNIYLLGTV